MEEAFIRKEGRLFSFGPAANLKCFFDVLNLLTLYNACKKNHKAATCSLTLVDLTSHSCSFMTAIQKKIYIVKI